MGLDEIPDAMLGFALGAAGDATVRQLAREPGIGDELRTAAGIDGALASCDVVGGTAPERVADAIAHARSRLG